MIRNCAYIDGSYNERDRVYGAGVILFDQFGKGHVIVSRKKDKYGCSMRNVAGEVLAATLAIQHAIKHKMNCLHIYYDYEGIRCWATKEWRRNNEITKEYSDYVDFVTYYQNLIELEFFHIKSHSGDELNEKVDKIAYKVAHIGKNSVPISDTTERVKDSIRHVFGADLELKGITIDEWES